ncbi:MAG: CehA/McbA family metallohydrolase [Fervidobacterium sp.]|nr:CehA/McbA family metallohydrolase [Fervidobacterium sp.]
MEKAFKKVLFIFVFALTVSSVFANDYKYSNLRIFYGNLHSHTLFSDGRGTPEQAYQHASKYGDVLAVTDHCYFLKISIDGKSKTYLTQQAARNSSINGKFVGLQGFEWTAGSGHINVYETLEYISRDEKGDLKDFYEWIIKAKKLAQFNHPGVTFGNFQDFWFVPEADKYVNLIEIGNGNSPDNDTISQEMYNNFILALNRGWHLGPTANQDNHRQDWLNANDSRTGILATELTYEEIMNALWNRRTFASEDKNVKLYVYGNDSTMGSILYDATQLTLRIVYEDINDPVEKLEVISQSGSFEITDVTGKDKFDFVKVFYVPDGYEWYFVKVVQKDGDEVISAPIWTESSSSVKVNYLRLGPNKPRVGQEVNFVFDIYNTNNKIEEGELKVLLNGKVILHEKLLFKPYDIFRNKTVNLGTLTAGSKKIEVLFDGKNIQSFNFEVLENTGLTILIDKLHENEFTEEFKRFVHLLENRGDLVVYPETMLVDYNDVDVIIIPGPSKDGLSFFKELLPAEIEWLNNFPKKIYILKGSDEEYFNVYLSLIKSASAVVNVQEFFSIFKLTEVRDNVIQHPNVVYIDVGHSNDYTKDKLTLLEKYLMGIGYQIDYIQKIEALNGKYLVIMNGKDYSIEEIKNAVLFVKNGGTLIITSKSDYQNGGNTEDLNTFLDFMDAPARFNDDQVVDEINNYGTNFKILANNVRFYSPCSIVPYGEFTMLVTSDTAKSVDSDGRYDAVKVDKIILAGQFNYGNGRVILLGKAIFSDYDFKYNEEFIKKFLFK